VGDGIGTMVGREDGVVVGAVVGDELGSNVGDGIGTMVGRRDGVVVGAVVGDELGSNVGDGIGTMVGRRDGVLVVWNRYHGRTKGWCACRSSGW
jgi:hypothetical protein